MSEATPGAHLYRLVLFLIVLTLPIGVVAAEGASCEDASDGHSFGVWRTATWLAGWRHHWRDAHEPFNVVGPLHYVGTKGLSAFLVTTRDGHILINTGMPSSGGKPDKA